jgi:hypothetical protein
MYPRHLYLTRIQFLPASLLFLSREYHPNLQGVPVIACAAATNWCSSSFIQTGTAENAGDCNPGILPARKHFYINISVV